MAPARWILAVFALVLATAPAASGHLERSSYWPDPAPDTRVHPPAGGAVPEARSLTSALRRKARDRTFVVCKRDSLAKTLASIRRARRSGYRLRPSQPLRRLSLRSARYRARLARRLARRCRFAHIQAAVFRAGNNDRVVIMPGTYREEPSRAEPTNDPRCANLREDSDLGPGAASYRYQAQCPNDQSLIYVQGRAVSDVLPPTPARADRRGLPDEGPCIRCNLQIEGTGVVPTDVVIDAGEDPAAALHARGKPVKDVGVRADRADGLVIRNLTTAHARENGIYVHELDGYLLERFASIYNGLYGVLNFTTDHGLVTDCELAGHRDSGVYPGGSPESAPRLNQAITRCDLHHNAAGYSASMGNAVHIYGNEVYGNATGIFTASTFPGGHPGYPQDATLIEGNNIYANNFDAYAPGSDIKPIAPMPVGVGVFILGGNDNVVRANRIWDNWRRGVMFANLPDAVADGVTPGVSRPPGTYGATSHRNQFFGNVMGGAPDGRRAPNGVDFWWDEPPGEQGNCWYDNGEVTSDPFMLPADCANTSLGTTYAVHAAEIAPCLAAASQGNYDPALCPWFSAPPPPGGGGPRSLSHRRAPAFRPELRAPFYSTPERLQVASCAHWRASGEPQRDYAVQRIRAVIAGPRAEGRVLSDAVARATFDARCAQPYASDFLLYEIYARAAPFG